MRWISRVLTACLTLCACNALPHTLEKIESDIVQRDANSNRIISDLKSTLSSGASVYGSDNAAFTPATARWSAYANPAFTVVVEPATEQDVALTVAYANTNGISFLAINQAHGSTKTLGSLSGGIQINLRTLQSIQISSDGKTARIQGGVDTASVINALWKAGKVTTTPSASCVGVMGPALGGGHGVFSGFYGLVIDNLACMNVVLANGNMTTVDASQNSDLWWAMRGAGHNYGIVTSFDIKIYDKPVNTWFYVSYVFRQGKLEDLFTAINSMMNNGRQPRELMNNVVFAYVNSISTTEPVIVFTVYYVGTAAQAAPYIAPYDRLGPVSRTAGEVAYPDLFSATGTGPSSPFCQDGLSHIQRPLGLLTYNVSTNRQVYNMFKNRTNQEPRFKNSVILFEGYSLVGVKAVNPASTAYPHRDDNIVVAPQFVYQPNVQLDSQASQWTQDIIDTLYAGQASSRPRTAYVNYAFGDEPVEQMYGWDTWRLPLLRSVKQKYDPKGAFNYYNPFNRLR